MHNRIVFFDLVGTIYKPLPFNPLYEDVLSGVKQIKELGFKIGFISNTSIKRDIIKEKVLKVFGSDKYLIEDSVFCTSGDVFLYYLNTEDFLNKFNRNKDKNSLYYYQIGSENGLMDNLKLKDNLEFFKINEKFPEKDPDFIIVAGETKDLDISKYKNILSDYFQKNIPLFCPNPDVSVGDFKNGVAEKFVSGYFAKFYAELGGQVNYFGKPYKEIFEMAIRDSRIFISESSKIFMIGDNIATDIAGISNLKKSFKFSENLFSVLLKRGLYSENNDNSLSDFIVNDIDDFVKLLRSKFYFSE